MLAAQPILLGRAALSMGLDGVLHLAAAQLARRLAWLAWRSHPWLWRREAKPAGADDSLRQRRRAAFCAHRADCAELEHHQARSSGTRARPGRHRPLPSRMVLDVLHSWHLVRLAAISAPQTAAAERGWCWVQWRITDGGCCDQLRRLRRLPDGRADRYGEAR